MIREEAAREAVQHFGLIDLCAVPIIAELLQDSFIDHPRALATAYRKRGDQISDAEKKALGIRKNGYLSRAAFAELTDLGRKLPLVAHERTLLRASFTLNRHRRVEAEADLKARFGHQFLGFKHDGLSRDCPACNRLNGMITSGTEAAIMPPSGCVQGCVASYDLTPKIDWLAGVR